MTASLISHALTDDYAGEVFKAHPTYPHLFVSDHGRVWSDKSHRFVGYRAHPGVYVTGQVREADYMRVTVQGHTPYIQVLVLETFVGPRPEGHDADHINEDSLDNRLTNLRWLPIHENRGRHSRRRSA